MNEVEEIMRQFVSDQNSRVALHYSARNDEWYLFNDLYEWKRVIVGKSLEGVLNIAKEFLEEFKIIDFQI